MAKVTKQPYFHVFVVFKEERFGEVLRSEDNRTEVFKIAKFICAANRDVVGENCAKNDKKDLVVTDKKKLFVWQKHYGCLLNEEFDWNKESLAIKNPTVGPQCKIEGETVRRVLGRMKCGKASGSFGVVAEMLQAFGEVGIGRMTDLFNSIKDEFKIPEDWNTSVILNCFKNKGETTDRENYRVLKLGAIIESLKRLLRKKLEVRQVLTQFSSDSCQVEVPSMLFS